MAKKDSIAELEEKLSLLEQNFLLALRKIAEQRLKLEREAVSFIKVPSPAEKKFNKKFAQKTLTVRLESSLGEQLAMTRETSDGLEDRLQETRLVFEDKRKAIDQMKTELDRRENVLISSIQQIEAYLRAVFYLKQNADQMYSSILKEESEQRRILRNLMEETTVWYDKKESLMKVIHALQPAKLHLKKMTSDLTNYSNIHELVQYYLVLKLLQNDLLANESQCVEEEYLDRDSKLFRLEKNTPAALLSKETEFLHLKSKLKNIRVQITELEEQIDTETIGQVKDAATRFDFLKWIKKLYLASNEYFPQEKVASSTLDMLNVIKDFVADALEVTERLKMKNTV